MSTAQLALDGGVARGAVLSEDGRYRYKLWRTWDPATAPALFVMLNPSTADADQDDPTIRRCMRFARDLGYGGLLVGNLYAYRATNPDELDRVDEPIGPGNWDALWEMAERAGIVICAWGAKPNRGRYKHRERQALIALHDRTAGPQRSLYTLGLTKDGHPRHPLYLRADARPFPFDTTEAAAS